ncbi:MAG TPA: metalloregulator ArsR/SmtB family transcription factor [Chloroflexota bacterium]|nr:metalloregulator ArsR/SmtB family transcription factor [Chloroflexota bacterium]
MRSKTRPPDCCVPPTSNEPLPEPERASVAAVFHALGDSTRLEIFRLIAAQSAPICVCDITSRFDVTQPTVSHHLKILREARLVTVARRGVWAYYAADARGIATLRDALGALRLSSGVAIG